MTPAALLFDLDGTLVDTAPDLGHAANCVRAELGLPPLPEAAYRPVASAGARGLLQVALGMAPGHAGYEARRESFLRHYREHLARASRLFPGMDEVLAALAGRGVRWGVATNKPASLAQPLMEALGLARTCAVLIGGGDVLHLKPAPDSLLRAAATLDLDPARCLYVGDDRRDVDAARAAGMPVVVAGWGYLAGEDPRGWNADGILAQPRDVLALL
ncbi:MAG TPA: phosphoglycolate phosphatase [Candidatus Binatia bacterium]|nr:phosphoglycolate phosphatase [Candidatus Binatia bacterium]